MATQPHTDPAATGYTMSMLSHLRGWLTRAYIAKQQTWARVGSYERLAQAEAAHVAFAHEVNALYMTWGQRYNGGEWGTRVEVRRWVDRHGTRHYRTTLAPLRNQRILGGNDVPTDELRAVQRVATATTGMSA